VSVSTLKLNVEISNLNSARKVRKEEKFFKMLAKSSNVGGIEPQKYNIESTSLQNLALCTQPYPTVVM